jgi:hypothetical protein
MYNSILAGDKPGVNGELLSVYGNNGSGSMWLAGASLRDISDDIKIYGKESPSLYAHYSRLYNNVIMLPSDRSSYDAHNIHLLFHHIDS